MVSNLKSRKSKKTGIITLAVTGVIFVALSFVAVNFKQQITDEIWYLTYKPSAQVASVADRAGLNDYGKFLFFASRPVIDGTQTFNSLCRRQEQTTSILGCFVDDKIYIYNVTDKQLDGITEVTAAHEMLHAVYMRMSNDDHATVDNLLEAEYQKIKNDDEIKTLVDYYNRTEPGEKYNELHSVIGTKIANISPALEAHYKKYFSNRSAVVALNKKYSEVFEAIQNQAEALAEQLNDLSAAINKSSANYNAELSSLNQTINDFNQRANSGYFSSQAQFYAERNTLTARINELAAERSTINENIKSFNDKLQKYNSLATESKKLFDSIDSTLAPAPSL